MKHFRLQIALRVLLLSFTLFCLAFLVVEGRFWATTWLLAGLGLLQIIDLIRYAEQTHWLLQRFFSSIRFDDFTASIRRSQQGRSLRGLTTEMERVMQQFREVRLAKESSYRYLEQVMHHLGVATLSLEDARRVNFLNPAAKRLLQVTRISTLDEVDPELAQTVREMRHGEKRSFRLTRGGEVLQLVISLTEFKLQGQSYQLVSFQNIRQEMARTEVDAWQKLIRVMTHEIMNSITPVSTLAETTQQLLLGPEPEKARALRELSPEDLEDLRDALAIIRSRSEGLINFVSAYRNLTRLPQPEFEPVAVADMLGKLQRLLREHLRQAGASLVVDCQPADLRLLADPGMLEQVLINLLLNAAEAVKGRPERQIELRAQNNHFGQVEIRVRDTGSGIPPDRLEQIFVPFFSTRQEGSGVGLSISRQIMQAHGGDIQVFSTVNQGSEFVLSFG